MCKSAKQNMLEHILIGTGKSVLCIKKRRFIHPAAMERD